MAKGRQQTLKKKTTKKANIWRQKNDKIGAKKAHNRKRQKKDDRKGEKKVIK